MNNEMIISLITVFLSVFLSYITTRISVRKDYRKEIIGKMYSKIIFPLYLLTKEDFQKLANNPNNAFKAEYIDGIRAAAFEVLEKSNGMYSQTLYNACNELSPETYYDFCLFIYKNYHKSIAELDYYLPYGYYGKSRKQAIIIFLISLVVLIINNLIMINIHTDNIGVITAVVTIQIVALIIATLSSKALY